MNLLQYESADERKNEESHHRRLIKIKKKEHHLLVKAGKTQAEKVTKQTVSKHRH